MLKDKFKKKRIRETLFQRIVFCEEGNSKTPSLFSFLFTRFVSHTQP